MARALYDSIGRCARCKVCEHQCGAAANVAVEAVSAERDRAEAAEARLGELENALSWETSCLSCARVLDSAYAETCRREQAEARLAEVRAVLLEGGQDAGTVRRRALAIIGGEGEKPDA